MQINQKQTILLTVATAQDAIQKCADLHVRNLVYQDLEIMERIPVVHQIKWPIIDLIEEV